MPTEPDSGVAKRLTPQHETTIQHPRSPYHFRMFPAVAQLTIMRMEKCRVGYIEPGGSAQLVFGGLILIALFC